MLRAVIEDPFFTENFDSLRNIYSEMEAVHASITFTLGSDPRSGVPIEGFPDPTIRLYKTTPIGNTPSFRVLYRYTSEQIILLAIERDRD